MRLKRYLKSLDSLATAGELCTPVCGTFDFQEPLSNVFQCFAQFGSDWSSQRIALVTIDGKHTHYVTHAIVATLKALSQDELESSPTTVSSIGEIAEPLERIFALPEGNTLTAILNRASESESEAIRTYFVTSADNVIGSICLNDLLKPPSLIYLLCLGLDLEAVTLEVCCRFPKCFDRLPLERRKKLVEAYQDNKRPRLDALQKESDDFDQELSDDCMRWEVLQASMMSDKKELLKIVAKELGLTASRRMIERTFEFAERIRNYVAHPSAEFSRNSDAARVLGLTRSQSSDSDDWPTPFSRSISEEVVVNSIFDLGKRTKECQQLVSELSYRLAELQADDQARANQYRD